jgi:hypothetical protein
VPAPAIDVEADCEASKAYSTRLDAEPAAAAAALKFELPQPEATELKTYPTGNPDDFRSMAQELTPPAAAGTVSDNIVQKALDMGQPASASLSLFFSLTIRRLAKVLRADFCKKSINFSPLTPPNSNAPAFLLGGV